VIKPPVALTGSRPVHPHGATPGSANEGDRRIQVTVVLNPPRLPRNHPVSIAARAHDTAWPTERVPLSTAEFTTLYAPPNEVVQAVLGVAKKEGLTVVEVSKARHDIVLEGPIAAFERTYRVRQREYQHELGSYRAHSEPIHLPGQLASLVQGVLGLDTIPHAHPHAAGPGTRGVRALRPAELAAHYRFPAVSSPAGRVAVLEFGGGVHRMDLRRSGAGAVRVLRITDGDGNDPGNSPLRRAALQEIMAAWKAGASLMDLSTRFPDDLVDFMDTVESTMDTQIVCGLLPDVPLDLVFGSPTADGWRRAIYAQLGFPYPGSVSGPGPLVRTPPSVISVSWGMSESSWGRMNLQVLHGTLEAAVRRDVTVCCSTGDFGSRNSPAPQSSLGVNYPAASTWALACGGTALQPRASRGHREVAWNERLLGARMAGGGGMSGHFPLPPFQSGRKTPSPGNTWLAGRRRSFRGRWIPDVAAHAGFRPGVAVSLLGQPFAGGGTSAATPIWAALVGRLAAELGRPLGWLTPALYQLADRGGFRDIRSGHNDMDSRPGKTLRYRAGPGWDPCTGLGAPDGIALLEALRAGPPPAGRGVKRGRSIRR
jgi:kumamolisin